MKSLPWIFALVFAAACGREVEREVELARPSPSDLAGNSIDPLAANGRPDLILFLRSDCPIANRYAPEIARIGLRFGEQVDVWLVYVDPDETPAKIREHVADYRLPGTPLRDPEQSLVARAAVEVTPEAALFDAQGQRTYRGRIDDTYVAYGKARAQPTSHELIDALVALLEGRAPAIAEAPAIGCPLPPLARREAEAP